MHPFFQKNADSYRAMFKWGRYSKGYEVSSKGDKRFSAFNAKMPDGRTLEMHYQCDVKGYCPGCTMCRMGKGKPPLDRRMDMWIEYLNLWKEWAKSNEPLLEDLKELAMQHNNTLTDVFATTSINQAHALATILNDIYFPDVSSHGDTS